MQYITRTANSLMLTSQQQLALEQINEEISKYRQAFSVDIYLREESNCFLSNAKARMQYLQYQQS